MTLPVHCKKLSVITYKSENSNIRRKIKGRHQPPLTFIAQLSASAASCVSLNTSAGVLTLSGTVTKSGREDAGYFTLTKKQRADINPLLSDLMRLFSACAPASKA